MTDFNSPEMQRALAADQAKLEQLEEMQAQFAMQQFEIRLALMRHTITLVANGVSQCVSEAIIDGEVTEDVGKLLVARFAARTQENLDDLLAKMIEQSAQAQRQVAVASIIRP